jgi:hypothetical protein
MTQEDVAREGIFGEGFLDQGGEAVEFLPHV